MKTTKKLLVLCLIAVMAVVSVMPSTFSWYAHSGETDYQGNVMNYTRQGLPLSLKQSNEVTMTTHLADKYSKKTGSALSQFANIESNKTQRYITTITNPGNNDVYADLTLSNITNNADVYVGTIDPVVNEKSYASRATKEKVDWDYEVIYFEPRNHYDWWQNYSNPGTAYCDQTQSIIFGEDTVTDNTDMNLEYQVGSTDYPMAMEKCPNPDPVPENGSTVNYDVYRAFVTTEADSLFFFNHYYITENKNLEWNRTPTVTDFAEGRVYYLDGKTNDYNNKTYGYHDGYNGTNLCVYYYYKNVNMAIGKTADIGLKKGSSEMIANREEFDYTGKTITYASNNSSKVSVSKDGLLTAKRSTGNTPVKITTTIEGEFGDDVTFETLVSVPSSIPQVPVVQNVKVPKGESVDVIWYVKNKSGDNASFDNIFCSI